MNLENGLALHQSPVAQAGARKFMGSTPQQEWVVTLVKIAFTYFSITKLFTLEYKCPLYFSLQRADSYLEWAAGWRYGNRFPSTLQCWSTCLWRSFIRFQTDQVVGVTMNCVNIVALHSCLVFVVTGSTYTLWTQENYSCKSAIYFHCFRYNGCQMVT